ncbi:MAG: histidine phosphatase family protein [Atopobiaceae bacterium]|jgi:broad specificity phosphatase PhoE
MKRVTFYYVRHGKTQFNRDQIIQGGGVDSPLIPETFATIQASAAALSHIAFAACYASPQGRAQQTAHALLDGMEQAALGVDTMTELQEVNFGALDGKPYAGHRITFASCFVRQNFSSQGGECGADVRARGHAAFDKMFAAAHDGDNVLVVAHGALLRYLLLEFWTSRGIAARKIKSFTLHTPNAGIATIEGVAGTRADAGREDRGAATFTLTALPQTAADFVRARRA